MGILNALKRASVRILNKIRMFCICGNSDTIIILINTEN